jgi:hypothetical protein
VKFLTLSLSLNNKSQSANLATENSLLEIIPALQPWIQSHRPNAFYITKEETAKSVNQVMLHPTISITASLSTLTDALLVDLELTHLELMDSASDVRMVLQAPMDNSASLISRWKPQNRCFVSKLEHARLEPEISRR